ncbi:MAG: hypothetical protein ACWGP1_03550 [Syntrophobacteria bacterium]
MKRPKPEPRPRLWRRHPARLHLARILHELLSRDHEDGSATWQPQGVGSEAHLNGTSQGPTSEDARKDDHIRGRSKSFMKYPG